MNVSYNTLKRYVDLEGVSATELQSALTSAGLEVEGLKEIASGNNLVIGHVKEVVKHPDSDHLNVCQVNVGSEVLQIVCGAPNVAANQKVIVALVGAVLPEIVIKKSAIRGVESNGMLCSLSELGVDKKSLTETQLAGIEVLSEDAVIGDDPLRYLGLDDYVLDISLTPNRYDCLALWSLALETGAVLDKEVNLPKNDIVNTYAKTKLTITSNTDNSNKFLGQIVNRINVKPSPTWLKQALNSVGMKSINNVVDISNYVMLETGQPLHFYDLSKLNSLNISVEDSVVETYTALDLEDYNITEDDLVIRSGDKTIGIAGIMGGEDSKIDENTVGILVEAASFDRLAIRKTSRRLQIDSEASSRFQKGIDPLGANKAIQRAIELLVELADAEDIEELVTFDKSKYTPTIIETSLEYINSRIGVEYKLDAVIDVFSRLNLNPSVSGGVIKVSIPSYRTDLKEEVDLSEEVIRMLGFDSLDSTLPDLSSCVGGYSSDLQQKNTIRDYLVGLGLNEVVTYSLVSESTLLSKEEVIELSNPLSEERKYYRDNLINSMLEVISYNEARSSGSLRLFELGNIYKGNIDISSLVIGLSGDVVKSKWQKQNEKVDFYYIKGLVLSILTNLGYDEKRIFISENNGNDGLFHPYQSVIINIDKKDVGILGRIHPLVEKKYDISSTYVAQLNLTNLFTSNTGKIKYVPLTKYPSIVYDLAIIVQDDISSKSIIDSVKKNGGKLVTNVEVFDVYKGSNLDENQKSIALSITFQTSDRTLSDQDVVPIQTKITKALEVEFNAIHRNK